jgi:gliding motility-associated-like protein
MEHLNRFNLLAFASFILASLSGFSQDCGDPSSLCFEQFNNIQTDTTDNGPLFMDQFSCGTAMNGSIYQITTLAEGDFSVVVSNVECDLGLPGQGDSLIVELFTSTTPNSPCNPGTMTSIFCSTIGAGVTITQPSLAADEVYYVVVYGDMVAPETEPAVCGYDLQIDGPAVEFYMSLPPENPVIVLEGQIVEIEGVGGVEDYLWTGEGVILDDTLANPEILPGPQGIYMYNLMGMLGECQVNETITIIVTPNIVPTDVITPNNDGRNDTWYVQSLDERFENAEVKVFNRWGQVVFKSIGYGPEREWDGTNNGQRLPMGAYYYIIELNLEGQDTEPFTGDISIIY